MAYTSGKHTLGWNSQKAHSPRSIVLARISFLTTIHNLMLTSHMPMPTPTGPHAPKLDVCLVVLAFYLLAVQLLTNASSSQQSPDHQQKQNSWPPMTQARRYFSSEASYRTSTFLRKRLLFSLKIMTVALLWGTHRNLPPVPDISTLNTSLYAIGWNVTSCSLSESIHLSICQTVWQRDYRQFYSIATQTSF